MDAKYATRGKGVVIPGFCVLNFNKAHKRTHWLAKASKGIHLMFSKKLFTLT
jgi:hypothetical protein